MTVTIDGTTGVSLVQDGVITDANLPAGSIIQVVTDADNSVVSNATTSYVDTGVSVTITPTSASNKILILVDLSLTTFASNSQNKDYTHGLLRDSTFLTYKQHQVGAGDSANGFYYNALDGNMAYVDSPNTTNAVTYKTQIKSNGGGSNNATVRTNRDGTFSSITVLEIKS